MSLYDEMRQQGMPTEPSNKTPAERMADKKARDDAERRRFYAERKALNERAAANFRAAENERERVAAQDAQVAHEQSLREALRQSYIAANGSEFGFTEQYPKLRAAHVERETLAAMNAPSPAMNAPSPGGTRERAQKTLDLMYGKRAAK